MTKGKRGVLKVKREYWRVEDLTTGNSIISVTREGAEAVFQRHAGYGHEVEMRRMNEDGSEDFIKRYELGVRR